MNLTITITNESHEENKHRPPEPAHSATRSLVDAAAAVVLGNLATPAAHHLITVLTALLR